MGYTHKASDRAISTRARILFHAQAQKIRTPLDGPTDWMKDEPCR